MDPDDLKDDWKRIALALGGLYVAAVLKGVTTGSGFVVSLESAAIGIACIAALALVVELFVRSVLK